MEQDQHKGLLERNSRILQKISMQLLIKIESLLNKSWITLLIYWILIRIRWFQDQKLEILLRKNLPFRIKMFSDSLRIFLWKIFCYLLLKLKLNSWLVKHFCLKVYNNFSWIWIFAILYIIQIQNKTKQMYFETVCQGQPEMSQLFPKWFDFFQDLFYFSSKLYFSNFKNGILTIKIIQSQSLRYFHRIMMLPALRKWRFFWNWRTFSW